MQRKTAKNGFFHYCLCQLFRALYLRANRAIFLYGWKFFVSVLSYVYELTYESEVFGVTIAPYKIRKYTNCV
jgi:hypothetical protein